MLKGTYDYKRQSSLDKDSKQLLGPKEETIVPKSIKSEVNFLILPFFSLWSKDVKKKSEIEYKAFITRGTQKLKISWTVSSNPRYGYPGPFDREVHKAVEQIISELHTPIQNPIPLGSLYSLYKRMGMGRLGGAQYKKIKESLKRIIATTIESVGTFYSKEKEQWVEDVFHIYDRVIFRGEKLPNGEIADSNYLYLNSWYLGNINVHYVKPIDWAYYKSLRTPIAQRLYELLSVKFYGLLTQRGKSISYKYSTICDLLPITYQQYFSDAMKALDPAHRKLKETSFLEDWNWEELAQKGVKKDWLIKYYPGERARREIRKFRIGEQLELELPVHNEEKATKVSPELSSTECDVVELLVQRGITKNIARSLVESYPLAQIQNQIEIFDWLKKANSSLVEKNPAGFLRKSIEENYEAPADFIRKQEKELIKQKNAQEMIENEKEQARLDEIQRQIDDYREQLDNQERQLLRQEAIKLIECDKAIKKEFVGDILIHAKESEIIRKRLNLRL